MSTADEALSPSVFELKLQEDSEQLEIVLSKLQGSGGKRNRMSVWEVEGCGTEGEFRHHPKREG